MKLKLNLVFLIGYLVVLSFILKKILYIPLGLAFLLFLLDKKINEETKNMEMFFFILPFCKKILPVALFPRAFDIIDKP